MIKIPIMIITRTAIAINSQDKKLETIPLFFIDKKEERC